MAPFVANSAWALHGRANLAVEIGGGGAEILDFGEKVGFAGFEFADPAVGLIEPTVQGHKGWRGWRHVRFLSNGLWALAFRSLMTLIKGRRVNAVRHRFEQCDGERGAVGQVVGAPLTRPCIYDRRTEWGFDGVDLDVAVFRAAHT